MSWESINPKKPNDNELIGDEPFDVIADALDEVVSCYQKDLQRKPTTSELVKTFERVLAPRFSETVMEGDTTELVLLSFKTKQIPKRQKYQAGDFLKTQASNGQFVYGRIFEIGEYGPMVGVYDSLGFKFKSLEELEDLPLIVKVIPIHQELLQRREWTVIGNLPIGPKDKKQPRGPVEICGSNEHLAATNYFYGFQTATDRRAYQLDRWLNRRRQ